MHISGLVRSNPISARFHIFEELHDQRLVPQSDESRIDRNQSSKRLLVILPSAPHLRHQFVLQPVKSRESTELPSPGCIDTRPALRCRREDGATELIVEGRELREEVAFDGELPVLERAVVAETILWGVEACVEVGGMRGGRNW